MIKDDFMKKVLIGMFAFLFVFTIVMIITYIQTGGVPDTLIIAVFGACAGEYSICGLIKRGKEKERTTRMVHGLINEESAHDGDFEEIELD
jgi:hypothetical protein